MSKLELKDVTLNYDLAGPQSAPILVLSNSLGTNFNMWDPQFPEFVKHFRVLRYDARGHGGSSVPPGQYTLEQLASDVLKLLDELRIERVSLCGLSMGGMVGIWLGVRAPKRLDKLVLCNTAAKIGTTETWNTRIEAVRKGGMQAIAPGVLERWFTPGFRAKEPQTVASISQMLVKTSPAGYISCCAAIRDMDQREIAASIPVPTLVVTGAKDPMTPPEEGRFLASSIRQAQYFELDAAHLSNIEAASPFTSKVSQFLRS